nr:DUF3048 domain-containing protein [Neobacillus sp. Marseille-Q6967]
MKKWAVAATAALFLLSGCSNKEKANGTEEPVKEVEEVVEEAENNTSYTFPLTGLPVEEETNDRAIAVMVNNHPKARPQSGLHKADIVYEVLAEGDVTRFLAVFQSEKPKNIGPVRSARDYYIELAKGFNALYVAHGYSAEAEEMLAQGYIDNLNGMVYDGTLFQRADFRKAPHNSYISYENILKGAKENNYNMELPPDSFTFLIKEESEKISGDEASSVMITYSNGGISDSLYEYDATVGKYKRFSGGEQTIDLETEEPILIDNLFVIETSHQVIDDAGHKEIELESGGNGYLIQKGKVTTVQWKNDNGLIVPVKDGKVVPFVPGKTWVNVVPANPGMQASVSFNED